MYAQQLTEGLEKVALIESNREVKMIEEEEEGPEDSVVVVPVGTVVDVAVLLERGPDAEKWRNC